MARRSFSEKISKRQRNRVPSDAAASRFQRETDAGVFHDAILLREGDHRIKNSLQIVVGLMRVQARRADDTHVSEALLAASARVEAIARMHDALRSGVTCGELDVGAEIESMCKSLQAMAGETRTIVVRAEPIRAPIAFAQPILLAINELVINALRHAFPNDWGGTVTVSAIQVDGQVRVSIADDGAGLPVDHAAGAGYGMQLVNMMVTQVGGALRVESGAGARFTLTAPAPSRAQVADDRMCIPS